MKLTHPCKDTCSGYSQDCAEQIKSLQARVKELERKIEIQNEREASVCPEDVGAVEYIKVLQSENARLQARTEEMEMEHAIWADA